jgi:hypothetical protein
MSGIRSRAGFLENQNFESGRRRSNEIRKKETESLAYSPPTGKTAVEKGGVRL